MSNEQIYFKMQQLEASGFHTTFEEVFAFLKEGTEKQTFDALFKYVQLQTELIHNLENEVYQLRNPEPEPVQKFYPMSTTAKPIRR